MATTPAAAPTTSPERSTLGTIALALTVLSVLGFLVLAIGDIADWKGFSEAEDDSSAAADTAWSVFALGGILALVTGIIAWVRGRARRLGDVRAGQIAVAWFVLAIVISAVWSALD